MKKNRKLTREEINAALEHWSEGPERPFVKYKPVFYKDRVNMKVKFKKLLPGAVLPKKATEGSAAYDLYVPEDTTISKGRQIIPLGFAMEMEPGYQALVEPRSGFSSKGMEGYHVREEYKVGFDPGFTRIMFEDLPLRKTPEIKTESKIYIANLPERFDCDVVVGKIDADYREGIGVIVNNRDQRTFVIKAGTRIAQLTFLQVETAEWEETDTLSETHREGGFGWTGTTEINHGDY